MIKRTSAFKDSENDIALFYAWVEKLEKLNQRKYKKINIETSLGKTLVWECQTGENPTETLVIFPGFRTTPLIWDFDRGLDHIGNVKIFLVETNGQPNPSDGHSPNIKTKDYGHWANEVLEKLGITQSYIAGASFGGLVCMKLSITNPEKVKGAFLLNPGCLQMVSFHPIHLYYLILPVMSPSKKNIRKFLNKTIFGKPVHQVSHEAEEMLVEYEEFALRRYKDKTMKPYFMKDELKEVKVPTYLLEGTHDTLFPFQKSIDNAQKYISSLKEVKVFEHVGHGIETYAPALGYVGEVMKKEMAFGN